MNELNANKRRRMAKRVIDRGGRRDVFLGTWECQGYVVPCKFGEGEGNYDNVAQLSFGIMLHGFTYADEAYSDETKGKMSVRFWRPVMKHGVISFPRPEECTMNRIIREMPMKSFGKENFLGLEEFGGEIKWD